MFELVFLGTAAAAPLAERGSPALYVGRGPERFLIDCGEGTQRQLLRAGLGFRGLHRVLLTHVHLDHIGGLAGLVATRSLFGIDEPLEIIGSGETLAHVGHYLALMVGRSGAAGYQLRAVGPGLVATWPGWRLEAFAVPHRRTQSLAWHFAEEARQPLLSERLAAFGVPDGPLRRELAEGRPARLDDGRVVTAESVRGPAVAGAKLVVIGDVEDVANLAPEVAAADALIVEATYLDRDAALARAHGHLTAAAAAGLARAGGVGELMLTHISGRYPPTDILAEAIAVFPNTRLAADFERVEVRPSARPRPVESASTRP
jgi:ribonuclease Z